MASQLALVGCARGHGRPRAVACSVRLSRAVRVRQHARHRGVPYRCMVLPARACGRLSACACLRSIDGRRSVDCQRACVCGRLSACLCGARSRSVSHPCVCRSAWACVVSLCSWICRVYLNAHFRRLGLWCVCQCPRNVCRVAPLADCTNSPIHLFYYIK